MAETLAWNFVGNDQITDLLQKMDRVATRLDRVIDHLGDTTRGASRQMAVAERQVDALGDEMAQAARKADDLGDEMAQAGKKATTLAGEIAAAELKVKVLQERFRTTGDRGLLGQLRAERSALKQMRAEIDDVGTAAAKLSVKGGTLGSGLFSRAVGSPLTAALIGGAVAASPLIASALSGAVVLGLGAGAVAGGIVGAFADPRVKAATSELGGLLKRDLIEATKVFVEPTLDGIDRISAQWRAVLRPEVEATLLAASRFVDPVLEAGLGFVREILPGIRHAVQEAGPVFDVFKSDLPRLGRALGDMFASMGDNSEKAAKGLHDVFRLTELTVGSLEGSLSLLTEIYDLYRLTDGSILRMVMNLDDGNVKIARMKGGASDADHAFESVADSADKAKEKVRDLNDAFDTAFGKLMNVDQAAIAFKLGMIELTETIKENGRTLDETKEAGLRNRDALLDMVGAAHRMREAAIAQGDGTKSASDKANAAWLSQLGQIRATALALGLPIAQVDALIARYTMLGQMPTPITKTVRFVTEHRSVGARPGERVAFSAGGLVGGGGPRGVDSQPILAAPGEYVLTEDMVSRLGGVSLLERLRTGGRAAAAPAAPASGAGAAGGGDIVIINRIYAPDGRMLTESQQRYARQSGIRTVENLFDMPAV